MNNITKAGQLLYGLAVTAFGIEFFVFHSSLLGLIPLPSAFNVVPWIYLLGFLLIAGGVCIIIHIRQRAAALLLALLFFALCLWLHVPAVIANPSNGSEWTAVFELIALGSGALLSAAMETKQGKTGGKTNNLSKTIYLTGSVLFASSLIVFGILHFVYAKFIATLLPAWIPAHLFWAYFIGVAFTATAISLFLSFWVTLSASLLAAMFFLWVLLLHAPRVIASLYTEPEWTSMFVALAMGAISLQLAGIATKRHKK